MSDTTPVPSSPPPRASGGLPLRYGSPIPVALAKRVMEAAEAEGGMQSAQDAQGARAGVDALGET